MPTDFMKTSVTALFFSRVCLFCELRIFLIFRRDFFRIFSTRFFCPSDIPSCPTVTSVTFAKCLREIEIRLIIQSFTYFINI